MTNPVILGLDLRPDAELEASQGPFVGPTPLNGRGPLVPLNKRPGPEKRSGFCSKAIIISFLF